MTLIDGMKERLGVIGSGGLSDFSLALWFRCLFYGLTQLLC